MALKQVQDDLSRASQRLEDAMQELQRANESTDSNASERDSRMENFRDFWQESQESWQVKSTPLSLDGENGR